jgi:hypothetical protein
MATDVKLDQGDGTFLHLEARVVKAVTSDFMLDSPSRHTGAGPFRRAMVHDQSDGLTINFAGDYPGGVTLVRVAEIIPRTPVLVVRGGITYEAEVPTGAVGEGAVEGETHTVTVNLDELLNAHQAEIVALTARIAALEALLGK